MIFTSSYLTDEGRCARGTRENSLIKAFRMQCAASVFNEYNLRSSTVHFYCGKLRKYEKRGILDKVITKFLVCFLYVYEIDIDTHI